MFFKFKFPFKATELNYWTTSQTKIPALSTSKETENPITNQRGRPKWENNGKGKENTSASIPDSSKNVGVGHRSIHRFSLPADRPKATSPQNLSQRLVAGLAVVSVGLQWEVIVHQPRLSMRTLVLYGQGFGRVVGCRWKVGFSVDN